MTEIPEHLLRRSRERRAALGQGGDGGEDAGGGDAASSESSAAAAPAASEAAPVPAATGATAPAAPAAAKGAPPAVVEEELAPVYLADQAVRRTRIPVWAVPVLVLLPFWAILYAGAFGDRHAEEHLDPAVLGPQVYAANCASCHGAQGEGGSGPALAGGETALTFPDEQDHVDWVREGSIGKAKGTPYGDPGRPGGQRKVDLAGMPGFASSLTPEEIAAVVKFEREGL